MIFAGVKLMIVGMTTVFLFLSLMICIIEMVSRLTRGATSRELEAIRLEREMMARRRRTQQGDHEEEDMAVIAAAIAAFESERRG